jgi:hypothetical protein
VVREKYVAHTIGIVHRYPPPSKFEYTILTGIPLGLSGSFYLGLAELPWVGTWLAVILGCFAMGWLLEIAKQLINAVERHGYRAAINDLGLLCIGKANFRDGPPDDLRNLLAVAIVTLERGNAD